jgi:formylglycine-generating enzyme required for sulfatase activity
VRGTFDGATVRVTGARPEACEVLRPSADVVVLVVRGVSLRSASYRPDADRVAWIRVMGTEDLGGSDSRVVLKLAGSGLEARLEPFADEGTLLLLEDGSRPRAAAAEVGRRQPGREAVPATSKPAEPPPQATRARPEPPPRPAGPKPEPPATGRRAAVSDAAPAPRPELPPVPVEVRTTDDGMVVVAAGTFTMGSPFGDGFADEDPEHVVTLREFAIERTEVSVADFERSPLTLPRQPEWNWGPDQPVVNVTWHEAAQYCEWAGKRLPTEAEWEKAARGPNRLSFPWGNQWSVGKANSGVDGDGHAHAAPVGSFLAGASPYGALDMSGNVWEWVADWYREDAYASSPSSDPTGPSRGTERVARGGSFEGQASVNVRTAVRQPLKASERRPSVGFRCAR